MMRAPQHSRTYHVTSATAARRPLFQVTARAELLLDVLQNNRAQRRFHLYAFVVMPDHIHLLFTPVAEVSLEKMVQCIKGGFSFRLKSKQLPIWAAGYNETQISDRAAFEACVRYIHQNPVRRGLADSAEQFPFSSANSNVAVDPMPEWFQ